MRRKLLLAWAALVVVGWHLDVEINKRRLDSWTVASIVPFISLGSPKNKKPVLVNRPTVESSTFNWPDNVSDNRVTGRTEGLPGGCVDGYYALGSGTTYMCSDNATLNAAITSLASTTDHSVVVLDAPSNAFQWVGTKSIIRQTSGCRTDIVNKAAYDRMTGANPSAWIAPGVRVAFNNPDIQWIERGTGSGANLPLFDLGRQSGTPHKRGDGLRFIGVGFRQQSGFATSDSYFAFLGAPEATQNTLAEEPEDIHLIQCVADGGNGNTENRGGFCVSCRNITIQDSRFEHWWARNVGPAANADVQAVVILNSSGNIYVDNSSFDATGESFMVGGDGSSMGDTANIVIRRSYFWKDRIWLQGVLTALGYTETNVTTKNCWELKHGKRVVVEDCEVWNSYDVSGGGQAGAAIVPKFQSYGSPGYDPTSRDILFRGCRITSFQIGVWPNGFDGSGDASMQIADRLSDVHFIDCAFQEWNGSPYGLPRGILITTMLGKFHVRHCVFYQASSMTDAKIIFFSNTLDGTPGNACDELVFEDNIAGWGEHGTNGGISGNGNGTTALTNACVTYSVTRNYFMRGTSGTPAGYPAGNTYHAAWTDIFDSTDITNSDWSALAALPNAPDNWRPGISDWLHFKSRLVGVAA